MGPIDRDQLSFEYFSIKDSWFVENYDMDIVLDTFMEKYDTPKRRSRGENVVKNPARNTRKHSSDGRDQSISVISENDVP